MAIINLIFHFVAGDFCLGCVDDDNVITDFLVRYVLAAAAATLPRDCPSASMRYHFLSIDCGLMKIVFINSTFNISALKHNLSHAGAKLFCRTHRKRKVTESFGSILDLKFPGKGRFMKIALRLHTRQDFQRISFRIQACESVRFHAQISILS